MRKRLRRIWDAISHLSTLYWILQGLGFSKLVVGFVTALLIVILAFVQSLPWAVIAFLVLVSFGFVLWIWNKITLPQQIRIQRTEYSSSTGEIDEKPQATPSQLAQNVMEGLMVYLGDLAKGDGTIREKIFVNCFIYGPAVVYGRAEFRECFWNAEGHAFDDLLIEIEPECHPSGAIFLDACIFRRCTIYRVSFVGPPDQLERIKAGFVLSPQRQ